MKECNTSEPNSYVYNTLNRSKFVASIECNNKLVSDISTERSLRKTNDRTSLDWTKTWKMHSYALTKTVSFQKILCILGANTYFTEAVQCNI